MDTRRHPRFLRLVALQNAVEYNGEAVAGSVVGRIMGMRALTGVNLQRV